MKKSQQAAIAKRFGEVFGYPFEEGKARLGELLRRSVNMGAITDRPINSSVSRVSMGEADFALIAFFAYVGAGELSALGIEPEQIKGKRLVEIEALKEGTDRVVIVDDMEPASPAQIEALQRATDHPPDPPGADREIRTRGPDRDPTSHNKPR